MLRLIKKQKLNSNDTFRYKGKLYMIRAFGVVELLTGRVISWSLLKSNGEK